MLPGFRVGGVARQHVLQLRPGLVDQSGPLEGVGQGEPRGNGIVAPDRDLQGVDRIAYSPTPQIDAAQAEGVPRCRTVKGRSHAGAPRWPLHRDRSHTPAGPRRDETRQADADRAGPPHQPRARSEGRPTSQGPSALARAPAAREAISCPTLHTSTRGVVRDPSPARPPWHCRLPRVRRQGRSEPHDRRDSVEPPRAATKRQRPRRHRASSA